MRKKFQVLKWREFTEEWPITYNQYLIRDNDGDVVVGHSLTNETDGYLFDIEARIICCPSDGGDLVGWQWAYLDEDNSEEFNASQGSIPIK